jgi:hypothetical protein
MKENISISVLFEDEPTQWGFRGDPFLWREMKKSIGDSPLPDTEMELLITLKSAFEELTGKPISTVRAIKIERYDQGGMSGGMVSTDFWRDTAIPLILERFRKSRL